MNMQSDESIIGKIGDKALRELVLQFRLEKGKARREGLKARILTIIEERERDSFLARFVLRDFYSWNKVLTDEESVSTQAHGADFFESELLEVLQESGGQLEPLKPMDGEQEKDPGETDIRAMMDKKKAEALLDNIKENRSKYLRFQVPREKRGGVPSGKDW